MTQSGRGIRMKTVNDEQINDVLSMGLHQASEFNITDADKFINLILDNSYKDPLTATSREICQNASEVDPNFYVHLPTALEPWFSCIDNGPGLSKPDLIRYASGLGASTKDKDNTAVGGFGIGMKVPFTMADQYNIISRYDGIKYNFTAYKDEYGKAQFVEMTAPVETDEPNGLEVKVPVRSVHIREFITKFTNALRYFDPKPKTNVEVEWDEPEYIMEGVGWAICKKSERYYSTWGERSRVIMGNLWYPIDSFEIKEDYNDIYQTTLGSRIDITLPIGSIDLPLSREDIQYTPRTLKVIRAKVDEIVKEIRTTAQDVVNQCPSIWTAMRFHQENDIIRHLKLTLRYNGVELESHVEQLLPNDIGDFYSVDPYRFIRYKTLSLTDHRVMRRIQDKVKVPYQSNVHWFVVSEKAKRKPSRLLSYMKDKYRESMPYAYLVFYPEGGKAQAVAWINGIHSSASITDFDAEVPDMAPVARVSVPKAQRKKLAKVKVMKRHYGWQGISRDWWKDYPGDLELDNNTGIYVDLKANDPVMDEWGWNNERVWSTVNRMKACGLIPQDTVIYGCPANVKNRLKDHPNYMSVKEADQMCRDIISKRATPSLKAKLATAQTVESFLTQEDIPLDIDVKQGYYKQCSDYIDLLNRNKEITSFIKYELVDHRKDQLVSKIKDIIRDNFERDYPLLQGNYRNTNCEHTAEYIKMKSYIIEQGVKL